MELNRNIHFGNFQIMLPNYICDIFLQQIYIWRIISYMLKEKKLHNVKTYVT